MTLRLGLIDYVNIFPLTHPLEEEGRWRFERATPSTLNRLLADGELDASPVSSIEYPRHADRYVLLPDISISSGGEVQSVVLFSRIPLEQLHDQPLGICASTATSRVLLRIVLEDHVNVTPRYLEHATLEGALEGQWPAVLLIGDDALAFRRATLQSPALRDFSPHDLGARWTALTGLPMVFAVWAVRREVASSPEVARLIDDLRASREQGSLLPPSLLARAQTRTGLSHEALIDYYRRLHFTLGPREERALLTFYARAAAKGLCPPCSRIEYALTPSPSTVAPATGAACLGGSPLGGTP